MQILYTITAINPGNILHSVNDAKLVGKQVKRAEMCEATCGEMVLILYRVWDTVKMNRNRVVYQNKNSMAVMRSVQANLCPNLKSITVIVIKITHFKV